MASSCHASALLNYPASTRAASCNGNRLPLAWLPIYNSRNLLPPPASHMLHMSRNDIFIFIYFVPFFHFVVVAAACHLSWSSTCRGSSRSSLLLKLQSYLSSFLARAVQLPSHTNRAAGSAFTAAAEEATLKRDSILGQRFYSCLFSSFISGFKSARIFLKELLPFSLPTLRLQTCLTSFGQPFPFSYHE